MSVDLSKVNISPAVSGHLVRQVQRRRGEARQRDPARQDEPPRPPAVPERRDDLAPGGDRDQGGARGGAFAARRRPAGDRQGPPGAGPRAGRRRRPPAARPQHQAAFAPADPPDPRPERLDDQLEPRPERGSGAHRHGQAARRSGDGGHARGKARCRERAPRGARPHRLLQPEHHGLPGDRRGRRGLQGPRDAPGDPPDRPGTARNGAEARRPAGRGRPRDGDVPAPLRAGRLRADGDGSDGVHPLSRGRPRASRRRSAGRSSRRCRTTRRAASRRASSRR